MTGPSVDGGDDDAAGDDAAGDDAADASDDASKAAADKLIVHSTVDRLTLKMGQPAEVVETVVREELDRHRATARIQKFVPIFAERAARRRLKRMTSVPQEPGE